MAVRTKKRESNDTYEVVCEGQYYSNVNGQKGMGKYSITAIMDEKAKRAGFLSVFRNEILSKADIMRRKFPDWKRFRTHTIVGVRNRTANKPVREAHLMNRLELVNYINASGFDIDCGLYPEVQDLRQALKDFHEDYDSFIKYQEKRRLTKGPQLAVKEALLELNPWLRDDSNADPPGTPANDPRIDPSKPPQQEFIEDDEDPTLPDTNPVFDEEAPTTRLKIRRNNGHPDIIEDEDPLGILEYDQKAELQDILAGI